MAIGGEHRFNHLVVGDISLNCLFQPNVPTESVAFALGLHAEEVAPEIEEPRIEARGIDQGVDETGPLVLVGGIQKVARFVVGRKAADDIEVAATQEGGVINDRIWGQFLGFLSCDEDFVEFAGGVPNDFERKCFGVGTGQAEDEREGEFHWKRLVKESNDFFVGKERGILRHPEEKLLGQSIFKILPVFGRNGIGNIGHRIDDFRGLIGERKNNDHGGCGGGQGCNHGFGG